MGLLSWLGVLSVGTGTILIGVGYGSLLCGYGLKQHWADVKD